MTQLYPLSEEERLLSRRIADLCRQAYEHPRFTSFLNEREQLVASAAVDGVSGLQAVFFGGFEEAQRRMLGIFPDYDDTLDFASFPIKAIAAQHGKGETLNHRSVLGSLIALGLDRSAIGDISPEDGVCRFLVTESVSKVVANDLVRIGRTGVRCVPCAVEELVSQQEFELVRSTVSSLRLDCLVSMLAGISREKSAVLIKSGQVQQTYKEIQNISAKIDPGDTITIRGYGKFIVDSVGEPTRKGRLPVACRKYK